MKNAISTLYILSAIAFVNAQSASRVNINQSQFDVTPPVGMLWVNPADVILPPVIHNLPVDSIPFSIKMGRTVKDSLAPIHVDIDNLTTIVNALPTPVNADWNSSSGLSEILNKPSIPAAQVKSDWNSVSGVSEILNKPTLGTAASQNSSAFATAAQGALAQTALQAEVDGSITNEIELPTQSENAGRCLTTNGTTPSWGKKIEPYSGTTNGSGNYVVTYGTAYSSTPTVTANIIGGSNTNILKITSVSTTAFTINMVNRVDVIGLLPSFNNVNGASVNVQIIEQ